MTRAQITSVITLTSPLHISAPGNAWYNWDTGRSVYSKPMPGSKDTVSTVVRTRTMGIPKLMNSTEISDEKDAPAKSRDVTYVPEIPANSFRGMFRRAAADLIFEALAEKGEKASLDLYHMLTCGAVTGNPDSEPPSVGEVKAASANAFVGLFGGGPRFYRGALRVSHLLPICPLTIERNLVGNRQELASATNSLTQTQMLRRVDDLVGWFPRRASESIQDFESAVAQWMEECSAKSTKNGNPAEDSGRGLKAFSALEFVMPGTSFECRLEVDGRRDGQVGLTLLALQKVFNETRLGGKGSIGFGQFVVQMGHSYLTIDGKSHCFLKKMEGGAYELDMDNPEIAALVNSAKEDLAEMDLAGLEVFAKRPSPKKA